MVDALILLGALGKKFANALAVKKPPAANCSLASKAHGSDFSFARQQIGVAATQTKDRFELLTVAKFGYDEFRWRRIPLSCIAGFRQILSDVAGSVCILVKFDATHIPHHFLSRRCRNRRVADYRENVA
jgi:hypothetical protein